MTRDRVVEVRYRRAVVVGSGVAGLSAALALGEATVLTKTNLGHSGSTPWSQGGIAAALGHDDDPALHAADTVAVSGGIGDAAVAALLTGRAADSVARLQALGARFDRDADGRLALGREAGHSRNRIVHAGGDATGAEVARSLSVAVRNNSGIEIVEGSFAVDLLRDGRRIAGVLAWEDGRPVAYVAPAVVLATGGIGRVFLRTTNPAEVTGDGLAMAARAGARLADLEFVQFHPTALDVDLDPRPLLTEALRGEGAVLVDQHGRRFMPAVHPDAELAPRDVVARAIWDVIRHGGTVYLDATSAVGERFEDRFPTVFAAATGAGLDPRTEPLPVTPAAHYHMGGIATDRQGRSSLPGLWAAGEAASTGAHGANRLASNSLLEGVVFGALVARSIAAADPVEGTGDLCVPASALEAGPVEDAAAIARVREAMWHHVGVSRTATGLKAGLSLVAAAEGRLRTGLAGRNLAAVAGLVVRAALARTESRGGHFRADFPEPDAAQATRSFVTLEPNPAVVLDRQPVGSSAA